MREYKLKNGAGCLRWHDLPGAGAPILFVRGPGCAGSLGYPGVAAQPPLAGRSIHIEVVPDAGHTMAWENPAGLAQAIANALEI